MASLRNAAGGAARAALLVKSAAANTIVRIITTLRILGALATVNVLSGSSARLTGDRANAKPPRSNDRGHDAGIHFSRARQPGGRHGGSAGASEPDRARPVRRGRRGTRAESVPLDARGTGRRTQAD